MSKKFLPTLIIFILIISGFSFLKKDQNIVHAATTENQALLDEMNLVGNGEFEKALKHTWDLDEFTGSSIDIDHQNSSPISQDNSSLKIGIESGKWAFNEHTPVLNKTMDVSPNTAYRLSLWSKFSGEQIEASVEVYLYDSKEKLLWRKRNDLDLSKDWTEFETVIPSFADAHSVKIRISSRRSIFGTSFGELWFDSISLNETKIKLDSSIINDWDINNTTDGTITKDTSNKFNADPYSYKLSILPGGWSYEKPDPSLEEIISIDENSIYNIQLVDKNTSAGIDLFYQLDFLDKDQHFVSRTEEKVSSTTNWSLYNDYINVPKKVKYAKVSILASRNIFSASSSGDIWVSPNVQINKTTLNITSTEYLSDGEFKDDSMFADWIIPSDSYDSIERSKFKHKGEKAVKFKYPSGDLGLGKFLNAFQEINVEPNTVYEFSAWSRVLTNKNVDFSVKLEFFEDDYTLINDALASETLPFNKTTAWNNQNLTFKTSPSTNKIKITLQSSKGGFLGDTEPGSVLFDSISLIKQRGETSFLPIYPIDGINILKNADFKNGTNEWKVSHVNDDSSVTIDNQVIEDSEEINDGKSLKINVKPLNNDYGNLIIKQKIAVEPNTTYIFEGNTKGIGINNSIIRFNAEINNRSGTPSERYYYRVPYAPTSENEDWVKKVLAFKTGSNASTVTLTLQVSYPNESATGSVLFDKLKLVKSKDLNVYDYSPLGGLMPLQPDKSLTQIFDDINSNQKNWGEYGKQIAENQNWIDAVFSQIDRALKEMNEGLAQINKGLNDFNLKIKNISKSINGMNLTLKGVNQNIDDINIILSGTNIIANGKVVSEEEYEELLGKHTSNPKGLIGTINDISTNVDTYNSILKNVNSNLKNTNSKIDVLSNEVNSFGNDINNLNGSIKELNQNFKEYNKDILLYGNTLYDLADITNELSDNVNEYSLDLGEINENIIPNLTDLNLSTTDFNFSTIDMSGFTLDGMDISSQFPNRASSEDIDARMSLLFDIMPIISEMKAAAELGMTISNGDKLSTREYVLAALGVVGGAQAKGTVKVSGKAKTVVDELTNGIKITENYRRNFKAYTGYEAKGHVHHGLPKEPKLRKWFESKGINVQDPRYLYDLPKEIHKYSDYNGIHTKNSPLGKEWNAIWREYRQNFPDASKKDIENKLNEMEQKANIADRRAKPKN